MNKRKVIRKWAGDRSPVSNERIRAYFRNPEIEWRWKPDIKVRVLQVGPSDKRYIADHDGVCCCCAKRIKAGTLYGGHGRYPVCSTCLHRPRKLRLGQGGKPPVHNGFVPKKYRYESER